MAQLVAHAVSDQEVMDSIPALAALFRAGWVGDSII